MAAGAERRIGRHAVEAPLPEMAADQATRWGRVKKPAGCVAAPVPRTRNSHNGAASLLRTSGSKGALELSILLVSLWFRSSHQRNAATLCELRNRDTSPKPPSLGTRLLPCRLS